MKTTNYLDRIILQKQREVEQLQHETAVDPSHPLNLVLKQTYSQSKCFSAALKQSELAVIAEIKRKSPSVGEIRPIEDPVKLALKYCQGGASAISVLTDFIHFGGTLSDLRNVSQKLVLQHPKVAILRKDFIIHPLQLAEAVISGANAVLLIVHVVGKNLKFLMQESTRLGLEVLTEVHNQQELEIALEAGAPIIGINHRNLTTFEMDLSISEVLKPLIPSNVITVAESGIHQPEQAERMRSLGFDAILVGESLVRSNDAAQSIKLMKGEKRES